MKKLVTVALLCAMLLSCFAGCGMQKGEIAVADAAVVENVAEETVAPGILAELRANVNKAKNNSFAATEVSKWDGTSTDDSWYNADATELTITTAAQFMDFLQKLSGGERFGMTIKLGSNINLNGAKLNGNATSLKGVLDGQNHVIYNFELTLDAAVSQGFFGNFGGTEAKNFALVNVTCQVKNATASTNSVGTIFGHTNTNSTFTNLYCDAAITLEKDKLIIRVGGLVGRVTQSYDRKFINCEFAGSITSNDSNNNYIGGFVGYRNKAGSLSFTNCLNSGIINAPTTQCVGGILAGQTDNGPVTFTNCSNTGDIIGYYRVGGMLGFVNTKTTPKVSLSGCVNNATVTAKYNVGGMIGLVRALEVELKDCVFSGNLVAIFDKVDEDGLGAGGLIGDLNSSDAAATATLTDCKVTGTLKVDRYVYNNGNDKVSLSVAKNALAEDKVTITGLETDNGTLTDTLHSTMVGYQVSAEVDGEYALRMVAAADISEAVKAVGFVVTVNYKDAEGNKVAKITDKTVYAKTIYKSVKGTDATLGEVTYAAESYGADYLYTLVIEGIPAEYTVANGTLEVLITPFTAEADDAESVDSGLQIQHGEIA